MRTAHNNGGVYDEFKRNPTPILVFKLDTIFGLAEGRLRPFGTDFTKGNEPAVQLYLGGSILHMEIPQPATEEENKNKVYKRASVDLSQYLVNEDGVLTV